ncbi:MAG TPA: SMI1/KNR4 family protein [Kofleriaceae bacterium]|nr:SMI1/KNR4 family protein [Kofleriaceae bacterium]
MARARKKAKPKAKAKQAKPKAKAGKKPAKKRAPASKPEPPPARDEDGDAIPVSIDDHWSEGARTGRRRAKTAREWSTRSSPVVEILDDSLPIGALRRFLDSIKGVATDQQAQIALGAAQLMLLPIAREHRGGAEVKEIVDLVVDRWGDFGERRRGFHAQEFLRNALAAIGVDRARIAQLARLVPPGASSELLFNLACAHAVARDKVAMLRAVEAALAAGAMPGEFRRDHDFAPYHADPDLAAILARAEVPPIPVDVEPYLEPVRSALDRVTHTLHELGLRVELRPPVRLDAILDAERARRISLPNDYRALLTLTNGMRLWDYEFFGVGDYRDATPLAMRAARWLHATSTEVPIGVSECFPLASWGQPNDWLLYDPRGRIRGGEPGYVLMLDTDERSLVDLSTALARIETTARDVLGTN